MFLLDPQPSPFGRRRAADVVARTGRVMRKVAVFGGKLLIGILLLFLCLMMVFGPPVALFWETIDLCRMRERAAGRVDAISIKTGGHGTSRANIEYHFTANGREVHSTRYAPGFVGNWVRWTGGANVGRAFPTGKQVMVYYNAADPQRCALEYGWFAWNVAGTMVFGGLALQAMMASSWLRAMSRVALKYAGQACVVYGFALVFVGPPVVRITELPWHGLAWAGSLLVALLNAWWERRKGLTTSSGQFGF